MAYDANITAPNNKLNVKSLLDYIWYHDSDMSVGSIGYDINYAHGPCLCEEDRFDEMKRSVSHICVTPFKPAFQPRTPQKLSETFRFFFYNSGSEDLPTC